MIKSALLCMALNVYHEARGEPLEGQLAVADVVLNRVQSEHWPNSVCEVIHQPWQFSWTMEKNVVNDYPALHRSMMVARITMEKDYKPKIAATHYHATYIMPGWSRKMAPIITIGTHKFYIGR